MKFVLRQEAVEWRWELLDERSEVLCRSAIAFESRDEAVDALKAVRSMAPRALVFDPLGSLYEGI